jgi:DNA modification methylase
MRSLASESIDLALVDPPFRIGHPYDVYKDNLSVGQFVEWSETWITEVVRLLKPNGSFWLCIGDEMASDLDVLIRRKLGLTRRNWCAWHFSFGPNCDGKFTPSHTHLLHYVKNPKDFVFNAEAVKVPSLRAAKYGDKRAKAGGRLPNDVWVLDSKEASEHGKAFSPEGDVWYASRVAGTFKERVDHPAQMNLAILERIIKVSSNPGDLVFDPMCGSATTGVAAKKLGRRFLGVELSENYASLARKRLAEVA